MNYDERLKAYDEKAKEKRNKFKEGLKKQKKKEQEAKKRALTHLKCQIAEHYYTYRKYKSLNEGKNAPSYEELLALVMKWEEKALKEYEDKITPKEESFEEKIIKDFNIDDLLNQ